MMNILNVIIAITLFMGAAEKNDTGMAVEPDRERMMMAEENGESLYKRHCISCHQADGSGVPSMYPPLEDNERVLGEPEPLIKVLLMGDKAPFSVDEDEYMGAMASYKYLSDEKVATLLTYIRQNFNNDAGDITPAQVKEVRSEIE
ncbi:MAG: c-type cytochrome [Bacteroidota bacterium]